MLASPIINKEIIARDRASVFSQDVLQEKL